MLDRLGRPQPTADTDMIMRATAVPALAALAVIHVLDLPGTLGPEPLVGIGYFGIIAVAIMAGGAMIARSHWLAWAATGRAWRRRHGRLRADPRPARGLPGRPRRCRQLALFAGHRGAQRGGTDHPARGGLGLAYAGPHRQLGREDPVRRFPHPRVQ